MNIGAQAVTGVQGTRPGQAATDTENTVVAVFSEVLGDGESVDPGDDFFELGGNSIQGARLVARLRQELGVKVTIRDLFRARTARALAAAIGRRTDG